MVKIGLEDAQTLRAFFEVRMVRIGLEHGFFDFYKIGQRFFLKFFGWLEKVKNCWLGKEIGNFGFEGKIDDFWGL